MFRDSQPAVGFPDARSSRHAARLRAAALEMSSTAPSGKSPVTGESPTGAFAPRQTTGCRWGAHLRCEVPLGGGSAYMRAGVMIAPAGMVSVGRVALRGSAPDASRYAIRSLRSPME